MSVERFKEAQARDYNIALKEIQNGRKTSHWIWYIFPQIDGITQYPSAMNKYYSIKDIYEAVEYYNDDLLRKRLLDITEALLGNNKAINDIVGYIDAEKIKSCMTLFHLVDEKEQLFVEVIDKFYDGRWDTKTEEKIK